MSTAEERRGRVAEARGTAWTPWRTLARELADDVEELEQVIDAAIARVERAKALADDLLRQAASQLEAAWKVAEEVSTARDAILLRAEKAERAKEKAIQTGGCRGCAEDTVGPDGVSKHTCDAGERQVENYNNLVSAISAWQARAEKAEAELAIESADRAAFELKWQELETKRAVCCDQNEQRAEHAESVLRALIEALPRCGLITGDCNAPASKERLTTTVDPIVGNLCDAHGDGLSDLDYAAPLRAAIEMLGGTEETHD
jgi:hypothetical protein